MSEGLDAWIERQYAHSAQEMLRSLSPTGIVKSRPFFGQVIVPEKGASVATPVLGAYDPDPDYFFHWFRDSAIVLDALRLLHEDGTLGAEAGAHFADFVRFSLSLGDLDGRVLAGDRAWREAVFPDYAKFLRSDDDLAGAHGENILGETRVNPDGRLDISDWPRPQNDGPALRAISVLRWIRSAGPFDTALSADIAVLLRTDLRYCAAHWREPSFDIWEEESGAQYYTLRVIAAALEAGAAWLAGQAEDALADQYRAAAGDILRTLDGYWLPDEHVYRSRMLASGVRSTKERDIAVILAAIHADGAGGTHSVRDPRMHATLAVLEAMFDADYAINRDRPPARGPAMGRYAGDVYYSGGAYYFSTLGAAEFCFRAAAVDAENRAALVARGDAFLQTVRAFTPASGDLAEQFDQNTGAQTSAKKLAWSYAAFISCIAARRLARGAASASVAMPP